MAPPTSLRPATVAKTMWPSCGATMGLSGPPVMRAQREDPPMISRRSFLLGLTGLVTSAFVTQAKTHIIKTGRPMLLQPRRAEETLYLYEGLCGERNKWLVCLGPYEHKEPPPPTWGEYLHSQGYRLDTKEDIAQVCDENYLTPDDLENEIDAYTWADAWACSESSQAKAYALLKELKIGCGLSKRGDKEGLIEFIEGGVDPGSSERWVELRNDLTVSVLQAHLIERDLPLKITIDDL
jgi:hypothetical protein